MAKEEKERSQISWTELDGKIIAMMPYTNEQLVFDPKDLHESWNDFLLKYGIKQFCSSNIAGESFPAKARMEEIMKERPELTREQVIEIVKAERPVWMKANVANIRTALWNEFQALKVEKVKKQTAGKETKAQVEARVRAEMTEKMRASLKAQGMDDATIEIILKGAVS